MLKKFSRWLKLAFSRRKSKEEFHFIFPTTLPEIMAATKKWKSGQRKRGDASEKVPFWAGYPYLFCCSFFVTGGNQ
ncbi:MAG: hypothetical protein WC310_02725 [Patescibacteria group bacterium]|jgi:hypothetical protein